MPAKTIGLIAFFSAALGMAAPAFAGTIFTDQTFNLASYSASTAYTSDPSGSIGHAQCSACGDPGTALQFTSATNGSASGVVTVAQALINTSFSYDPLSLGTIKTLSAFVEKNISVNVSGTGFGNTFRPTIEQDGIFYLASVPGAPFNGPNSPGGTGYEDFSASLLAANFLNYDFTTGMFGTMNPIFGGDPMLFGLTQISGVGAPDETLITQYDNLTFAINVPEPFTLSLFGAGLFSAVGMRRRKKA